MNEAVTDLSSVSRATPLYANARAGVLFVLAVVFCVRTNAPRLDPQYVYTLFVEALHPHALRYDPFYLSFDFAFFNELSLVVFFQAFPETKLNFYKAAVSIGFEWYERQA